ncbi:hypothetical protein ABW19_dt0204314 [Dactylella cylindrospora]|nr:hypothetical protein ABW19_dt0204314 [Dactylella cylindrospora]
MPPSSLLPSAPTCPPTPRHIAYYISSHGYGHATRAIQLCHSFLNTYPDIQVTVVSQASSQIFLPLLNSSERVNLRPVKIDSAVLQPTPYLLDVDTTVSNLLQLRMEQDEIVETEAEWLKSHRIDLVIADAPYIPCIAASNANIMSMLITNFSFAEVFSYFHSMVSRDIVPKLSEAVDAIVKGYNHADVWLRLPGWLPNPGFLPAKLPTPNWIFNEELAPPIDGNGSYLVPEMSVTNIHFRRRIIDTPLITRPATLITRPELLEVLRIPPHLHGHKILLLLLPLPDPPPKIPSDWICLVAGSTPTMLLPDRYFIAPGDIHIPDAMKISSCVMAKLGYGTVSEVLAADVPVIYIPRRQFIEEYGLRRLVETWSGYENRAHRMEIEDFERGAWWDRIVELERREKRRIDEPGLVDNGSTIRQVAVEQWRLWNNL